MTEDHPRFKSIFKKRVGILGAVFAVSAATWILVLERLNPYTETGLALSLFMLSFFLMMGSLYAGILLGIKLWRLKEEWPLSSLAIAIRQGYLLSFGTILCLSLLMLGVLRLWNGILLVALITLIEAYFSKRD